MSRAAVLAIAAVAALAFAVGAFLAANYPQEAPTR